MAIILYNEKKSNHLEKRNIVLVEINHNIISENEIIIDFF
jgi:hypothetical protein